MRNKIIDLTKELVRYKSVSGCEEEKRAVLEFSEEWFLTRGFEVEKFEHESHPSLLVNLPGGRDRNVLLMAHLDVVSADDELFAVKVEDDYMRGRGVSDDKGAAAMLMLLAEKLKNSGDKFSNVKILFTTDEEIGGIDGAKKLSKFDHFKNVELIIVPDGGMQNMIIHKEKGIIQLFLEIKGKSAHGAKPWLAENSIEKAIEIYQRIVDIFSHEDKADEKHWHSTVSLTKLISGKEINKIPETAEMGIDVRFIEDYDLDDLLNKIKSVFDESVTIKKIDTSIPLHSQADHEHILNYKNIMQNELGTEMTVEGEHGGSDAAHFMHLKVPIIIHRADGGNVHANDEWVSISSIEKMMKGLEEFLKNF